MKIFHKLIRVITVAPFMALAMLTVLYVTSGQLFRSVWDYLGAIFFLTILPLLAYPLQPLLPRFKDRGRDGQRVLAINMAFVGYLCGILFATLTKAGLTLWVIYCTYLLSGLLLLLLNKVFHCKASGHACGIAGPIVMLVYLIGPAGLWGLVLYALAIYSSLAMKRHTVSQLAIGSFISPVSLLLVVGVLSLFL